LERPEKELKGFTKVYLDPGENRAVSVTLDRDAFAYYDEREGWTVSPGRFEIAVGRSSRDLRGQVSIEVS